LPKKQRKRYYVFQKKSKNILFLAGQGGGKSPPLPSPADAHAQFYCFFSLFQTMDFVFMQRAKKESVLMS
jgi:hypothetical protein